MACRRCLGYTINVPGASPTSLTFDVGTDTSASACLTSSTTTRQKSSPSGTVWSVEDPENTLPIATNRGGSPTYNLHRYEVPVLVSSSSSSAAELPFVLALPCVGNTTPSCRGVCCYDMPWIPTSPQILFLIHVSTHLLTNLILFVVFETPIHL